MRCYKELFKVEAALTNDPESDELLKLKSDLNVGMLFVGNGLDCVVPSSFVLRT